MEVKNISSFEGKKKKPDLRVKCDNFDLLTAASTEMFSAYKTNGKVALAKCIGKYAVRVALLIMESKEYAWDDVGAELGKFMSSAFNKFQGLKNKDSESIYLTNPVILKALKNLNCKNSEECLKNAMNLFELTEEQAKVYCDIIWEDKDE